MPASAETIERPACPTVPDPANAPNHTGPARSPARRPIADAVGSSTRHLEALRDRPYAHAWPRMAKSARATPRMAPRSRLGFPSCSPPPVSAGGRLRHWPNPFDFPRVVCKLDV